MNYISVKYWFEKQKIHEKNYIVVEFKIMKQLNFERTYSLLLWLIKTKLKSKTKVKKIIEKKYKKNQNEDLEPLKISEEVNFECGLWTQKLVEVSRNELLDEYSWKLIQAILGSKWRSKSKRYERVRPK